MPADQAQQYDLIGVKGVIGYYFQALDQLDGLAWTARIANSFDSTMDTETYAAAGMVPQLREWLGAKQAKSFTEQSVRITNKDFESTIRIKNKDRRRDKTGSIQARMGELAQRAIAHNAKLVATLINTGTATTNASCYDGLALFSSSHKVGTQTINNSITVTIANLATGGTGTHGTTTQPSVGEMALTIMAAVKQIYGFVDDQGEPINEMANSFDVHVPVALSDVAEAAVKAAYLPLGMTNPIGFQAGPAGVQTRLNIVVNPRLTFTDKVAVFRTDGYVKPFIIQTEVAPMVKALAEGSDNEFLNNEILIGVEKSGNVGIGRFDQACLVQMV